MLGMNIQETNISTTQQTADRDVNSRLNSLQSDIKNQPLMKRLLNKQNRRKTIGFSLLFANVTLLVIVAVFVLQKPNTTGTTVSNAVLATKSEATANPLDTLSSADIALNVARVTNLPEQTAVANLADSMNDQLTVTPADDIVVTQPQIIASGLKSRADIQTYVVQAGDTVSSIATKFGVTSDTIRWTNNLTGDAVGAGTNLTISPVNGLVYTVQAGDTIDSLVGRFGVDKDKFVAFNDLESGKLPGAGEKVVMPDGRPAPTGGGSRRGAQPTSAFGSAAGFQAVYGPANGYDYGYCTWHAANRRAQSGRPIPTNLGHAKSWYSRAQGGGMAVGATPQAGAVLWHANLGGLGHVAYVESMNEDGSALVSDMNYPSWGRVTYRTVPPSEFGNYRFIY
jgi:surface antigen/LysM repeat protein